MKNKLISVIILVLFICGQRVAAFELDASLVEVPDSASVQSSEGLGSLLGQALEAIRKGELQSAVAFVDEFLADHPATAASEEILGTCLALQGKLDKGLAHLVRAIELNPYQGTAYVKIGDIFLAKDLPEEAKKMFEIAVSINPEDRLPFQRLGLLYEREGYVERAIINFEKGLKGASPDYLGIKLNLARLYNETQQFEKTISLLSSVVSEASENVAARMLMGAAAIGLGQKKEALQWLEGVNRLASRDLALLMSLSVAYQELGESGKALAVLERARLLTNDGLDVLERMFQIYLQEGLNTEALALAASLSKRGDAGPELVELLATVYQNNLRFQEAETLLQQGRLAHPTATALTFRLGLHYALVQNYQQAVETLKLVIEKEPENSSARRTMSMVQERLGNGDEAIEHAQALVSIGDGGIEDRFLLATLLDAAERSDEAFDLYQEILAVSPRHTGALNNVANYYLRSGDLEKAKEMAQLAVQEAPDHPMVLDTLGWIQYHAGDPSSAIATLQRAAERVGAAPIHRFHLAASYAKAGRLDEAIAQLEGALESEVEFRGRLQAEELYESLLSRNGTALTGAKERK